MSDFIEVSLKGIFSRHIDMKIFTGTKEEGINILIKSLKKEIEKIANLDINTFREGFCNINEWDYKEKIQ